MKVTSFLKLLNRKIKKYDAAAAKNPFVSNPVSITLVWVDKDCKNAPENYDLDKY